MSVTKCQGRLTWWVALSFSIPDKTDRVGGGALDRISSGSIFHGESRDVWTSPGIPSSSDPDGIDRRPEYLLSSPAEKFRKVFSESFPDKYPDFFYDFPAEILSGFSSFSPFVFSVVFGGDSSDWPPRHLCLANPQEM